MNQEIRQKLLDMEAEDRRVRAELAATGELFQGYRICYYERRPQRYGTQFDWDENGQMMPWKLEAPERVDEYRRTVGLEPLSEKIEEARRGTEGETPPDFKKRQEEILNWVKAVGWM